MTVSLPNLKSQILDIEQNYSSMMGALDREWESPEVRNQVIEKIKNAEHVGQLFATVARME